MAMHSPVILCLLVTVCALLQQADSNEAPRFVNFPSPLTANEDISLDTTIGVLEAVDNDDATVEFAIQGEIANLILRLERVGPRRVEIRLKKKLDRETVSQYNMIFQVSDSINTIQKPAILFVIDVNDNKPSFTNLPYRVYVPEDSVVGLTVFKVSATDPDSGIWGLVSYNIITQQGFFEVNAYSGDVTLKKALDYEVQTFYQLETTAVDGDGLNSSTDLIIYVVDVQDTPPYFLRLPYLASVPENATVGTTVMQVAAEDGDRGVPNAVNYTFLSDQTYFQIDRDTGVITVSTPLDREDAQMESLLGVITLTVRTEEVTASAQSKTTATAAVTIRILDVNDETPMFNHRAYEATVLENTQTHIPVTLLPRGVEMIVKDHDKGDNGRLQVWLEGCDTFEVVPARILNEATLIMRVKNSSALDYEIVQNITFQIVAQEYLTEERHMTTANITVHIKDVNDNWPRFDTDHYVASIYENSARGTFVTRVTASDKDSGIFAHLTYNILGARSDLFSINSSTGDVTVAVDADHDWTILDREKLDTHQVTIEAVDGGGKRSSVRLDIHLLDINDQSPEMSRSQYESFVRENEATLERVVVIEATDRDLPPNNNITYSIISGDTHDNFSINPATGHMLLAGPIDYEAMDPELAGKFTLVVMAKDHGMPPLNSTVTVYVHVQDMNDRRPIFERETYSAVTPENCTGGTYVTTVAASDSDITAPNNEVIYQIQSGSRDRFRIDARSGIISVELGANLDRDVYGNRYTLKVLARDRGSPQLSGSTMVHVTITDINDKVPIFSHNHRTVHLLESAALWQEVATYTATDLDENSQLRYSLVEGAVEGETEGHRAFEDRDYLNSLFGVHQLSGTLYVKARLDRETVEQVTVTILVEDVNAQIPSQQNATAKLTIILDDVNDNSPVFAPSASYIVHISEASQPGLNVKQLVATDADKDSTLIKYYIIHNTEQSNIFEISEANRESGVITLNRTVDHEQDQWINFTVLAVDDGMPALSATANVAVQIRDINDNSPEWRTLESIVDIWENITVGTEVTTVWADDRDNGEFGNVLYFIKGGAFGKFQINNKTGVITTLAPLDREDIALYSLTLEARDNPGASLSEQRKTPGYIRVRLLDVNDNRPAFEQTWYAGSDITENTKVGAHIVTVKADDADIGDNGIIAYSIDPAAGNSSDLFSIQTNANSGRVYVSAPLHGKVGVYYVVVVARDRGGPSLWSAATVIVHVEDVNDHTPTIVRPPQNQTVYILENVPEGFFVIQVTAIDKDTGTNGQVRYELVKNPSSQTAWQKFRIDATSGNITTAGAIDREMLETYYLDVRAYDLGTPSYDDRRTLTIVVVDIDDNPPTFDRKVVPSPYRVSVLEEHSNINIATVALATDPDLGNNSHICYYVVGGDSDHWSSFHLDKVSGRLQVIRHLDHEVTTHIDLLVRASEDCWTDPLLRPENKDVVWDKHDTTLLWVQVEVKDINDNAPKLAKMWFTAGVSEDTQVGATVLNLAEYTQDPDERNNSMNSYYIESPFRITQPLETQLRQRGEDVVFRIGRTDGIIRTNIYFQADMQGYFEFVVIVNDSVKGHQDSTNVSVYLLSGSQRVRVILRGNTQEVGSFKDHFADFLSNITHMIINVDSIQTHQDKNGKPDSRKTDMFLHAVDPKTGKVLDAGTLIALIDKNYIHLVHLFKTYNVIEIVRSKPVAAASSSQASLQIALILLAVFLGCLLVIVCISCFMLRNRYKRKLKAATAMAFANHNSNGPGSREVGLNRLDMPGTNLHSHEGSNPVWLGQYEPAWPQQSDKDSGTSVDNNVMMSSHYDEQEMSVEMYNDEYDNYNRVPALTEMTTTPVMTRNRSTPSLFPRHAPPVPTTSNHNGLPRKQRRKAASNKVNCNGHKTETIANGLREENGGCFDYTGSDNHAYLPAETFKKMDGIEMESTEI